MKNVLFLVVLLSFCPVGFLRAQIATYQISLVDSTLNILYVGVDNEVVITNLPKNSALKIDDGEITSGGVHGNKSNFEIRPDKPGNSTLHILNKNKEIFRKEFSIERLAAPRAQLGNIIGAYASVGEILANPYLWTNIPGARLKRRFMICHYTVFIKKTGADDFFSEKNDSGWRLRLDDNVVGRIRELKPGDKINIDLIQECQGLHLKRELDPINITIR